MVWFSNEVITSEMLFDNYIRRLSSTPLLASNSLDELLSRVSIQSDEARNELPPQTEDRFGRDVDLQRQCAQFLSTHMSPDGLIPAALDYSMKNVGHVMDAAKERLLMAFFSMTDFSVKQLVEYDRSHSDFPLTVTNFWIVYSMLYHSMENFPL